MDALERYYLEEGSTNELPSQGPLSRSIAIHDTPAYPLRTPY